MHYALEYLPRLLAKYLMIFCTLFMLAALITGIVVHKKYLKIVSLSDWVKKQRNWLNAHNIFSVLSLPFQLMITYRGLLFF